MPSLRDSLIAASIGSAVGGVCALIGGVAGSKLADEIECNHRLKGDLSAFRRRVITSSMEVAGFGGAFVVVLLSNDRR